MRMKPRQLNALKSIGWTSSDIRMGITKEQKNQLIEDGLCSTGKMSSDEAHEFMMQLRVLHDSGGDTQTAQAHINEVNNPANARAITTNRDSLMQEEQQRIRNAGVRQQVEADYKIEQAQEQSLNASRGYAVVNGQKVYSGAQNESLMPSTDKATPQYNGMNKPFPA